MRRSRSRRSCDLVECAERLLDCVLTCDFEQPGILSSRMSVRCFDSQRTAVLAASVTKSAVVDATTTVRCRRDHLTARSSAVGRLAWIGWSSRNRLRSSANARAEPIPSGRLLFHGLEDDRLEIPGDRRVDPARSHRIFIEDSPHQLVTIAPIERRAKRQQFVKRYAQSIQIGSRIDRRSLAPHLLGAHVTESTDEVAGPRQVVVLLREPSQAEVGDPEMVADIDQKIRWLDVAVNDADLVGMLKRKCSLESKLREALCSAFGCSATTRLIGAATTSATADPESGWRPLS